MDNSKENMPKYQIIYEELKEQIENGALAIGEKMLSEQQLMDKYGFSRQTVRKALEELTKQGYVQKVRGSGSFVKKPSALGDNSYDVMFVALFAQHYFFSQYIGAVENVLRENGYTLSIGISDNKTEEEERFLKDAIEKGYAGIVLIPAQSGCVCSNLHIYKKIRELGIPCVMIGGRLEDTGLPGVGTDNYAGGKMAAEYLIKKGHRKIACIMNKADYSGCMRYSGYRAALEEAGIKADKSRVMWFEYETMKEFLEDEKDALFHIGDSTAIICYNDEIAVKIINLLEKNGRSVPDDVSVIGFDDSYMCMFGPQKLTSVRQFPLETGKQAALGLLELMKNVCYDANKLFEPTIAERDTVRDLNG